MEQKTSKKKVEWGWGWFLVLGLYSGGVNRIMFSNSYAPFIAILGMPAILLFYYYLRNKWIRNERYGDKSWMASLTAGIISYIVVVILVVGLIGVTKGVSGRNEAKVFFDEMQKEATRFMDATLDNEELPQGKEERVNTTIKTKGDFGEIEKWYKEYLNQIRSLNNDYIKELTAIGWMSLLDSERLSNDNNLVESKLIIKRAKEISIKFKLRAYEYIDNQVLEGIKTLNVDEKIRKSVITGYQEGLQQGKKSLDIMWKLEDEIIAEIEKLIDFLSVNEDVWTVSDGQIFFHNDRDVMKYNNFLKSIQDLTSQQEALQRSGFEKANKKINQLKDGLR